MQHNSTCMTGATKESGRQRNGGKRILHLSIAGLMIVLSIAILALVESGEAQSNVQRRGFKSSLLSTARGFGKRAFKSSLLSTARGFGKRAFKSSMLSTARGFGKRPFSTNHIKPAYADELSSIDASRGTSQLFPTSRQFPSKRPYDVVPLMHLLNQEASSNPRFIPLLLEYMNANADGDVKSSDEENGYEER